MIWPEKKNIINPRSNGKEADSVQCIFVTGVLRSVNIRSASLNHLAEVILDEPNDSFGDYE